ncbi:hypothetical protein SCLCIDRAFT_1065025 [Scleroderma citrinum Foug A]|uniref:Uncharacterized protein n=1 Tax=Scleroderma citrinum Foug A TaxID=1036808 RepID=A0A0C3A209_9AGAM|nr:hypothetical protein SCLCIDRAFT_1065025 [Scleroderma citrinum Foug A]
MRIQCQRLGRVYQSGIVQHLDEVKVKVSFTTNSTACRNGMTFDFCWIPAEGWPNCMY